MTIDLAITGHRNLGRSEDFVRREVRRILDGLAPDLRSVNLGAALGFDTMAMEHCVERGVPFTAFMIEGQAAHWTPDQKRALRRCLLSDRCVGLRVVADDPSAAQSIGGVWAPKNTPAFTAAIDSVFSGDYPGSRFYYARNRMIVDASAAGICCHDGRPSGGTANTLNYARGTKPEMQWHRIDPREAP